jgi:hypothetical protein
MATNYDTQPTLEERIRASRLVVVGRVESIELLKRERVGEVEEQQAIAHIVVDALIRGAGRTRRLGVRFILPAGGQARARTHPLREGQRLVMFLVPDVGRDARPNTFVAYLRGHYALSNADTFSHDARRVSLKALRDSVRSVAAAEAAEGRAWEKYETALVNRRELPPITEVPEPQSGSGPAPSRPAATGGGSRVVRKRRARRR